MEITPSAIIEELIDELAMGPLGQSVEGFTFSRPSPGALHLDYGSAGAFLLRVERVRESAD